MMRCSFHKLHHEIFFYQWQNNYLDPNPLGGQVGDCPPSNYYKYVWYYVYDIQGVLIIFVDHYS